MTRDPRVELVIDTIQSSLVNFLNSYIDDYRNLVTGETALPTEQERLVAQSLVHGMEHLHDAWFTKGDEAARDELRPTAEAIVKALDKHKHDPWETF